MCVYFFFAVKNKNNYKQAIYINIKQINIQIRIQKLDRWIVRIFHLKIHFAPEIDLFHLKVIFKNYSSLICTRPLFLMDSSFNVIIIHKIIIIYIDCSVYFYKFSSNQIHIYLIYQITKIYLIKIILILISVIFISSIIIIYFQH